MKNPTDAERAEAEQWRNAPTTALEFFEQVGDSLKLNDIPAYTSGLGGTLTHFLPKWVVPQSGAGALYFPPSAGQQGALALFAPLGLSESGFRLPCNWGTAQTNALQAGFEDGVSFLNDQLGAQAPAATNYWTYKNANWGTWPNTVNGYIGRGVAVVAGGFASMPADGTYSQQTVPRRRSWLTTSLNCRSGFGRSLSINQGRAHRFALASARQACSIPTTRGQRPK